jgi:dihydroxy-acid dehydratase
MHYILPSREIICNEIEIMVQAHQLDAIVMLGSCDKIVPGMLMAAARLDIPAILVPGGPMLGGVFFDGRKSDMTTCSEALGMLRRGKISEEEFVDLEELAGPSCGSCAFFGTANTMCSLSEALGMTLPGGALIPATHADRLRMAQASGLAICQLVKEGINARRIINEDSLRNAVKVCLGVSGSTNAVLHLSAVAYEAEVDIDIVETFDEYSKNTPQIAKVNPAAKWDMEDFWKAGGIPRVVERMAPLLNQDVMTCTGATLEENIKGTRYRFPENKEIIKTLDEPFQKADGLAVLRGNLAPDTGVSKPGAIDPALWQFTGTARVFDSEEEANKAILARDVQGHEVSLRSRTRQKNGPGYGREVFRHQQRLLYWAHLT